MKIFTATLSSLTPKLLMLLQSFSEPLGCSLTLISKSDAYSCICICICICSCIGGADNQMFTLTPIWKSDAHSSSHAIGWNVLTSRTITEAWPSDYFRFSHLNISMHHISFIPKTDLLEYCDRSFLDAVAFSLNCPCQSKRLLTMTGRFSTLQHHHQRHQKCWEQTLTGTIVLNWTK